MEQNSEVFPSSTASASSVPTGSSVQVKSESSVKPAPTTKTPKPRKGNNLKLSSRWYNIYVLGCLEFPASELKESLMPIISKLFNLEPDGHPFRYPVDADRLNIPVSEMICICRV